MIDIAGHKRFNDLPGNSQQAFQEEPRVLMFVRGRHPPPGQLGEPVLIGEGRGEAYLDKIRKAGRLSAFWGFGPHDWRLRGEVVEVKRFIVDSEEFAKMDHATIQLQRVPEWLANHVRSAKPKRDLREACQAKQREDKKGKELVLQGDRGKKRAATEETGDRQPFSPVKKKLRALSVEQTPEETTGGFMGDWNREVQVPVQLDWDDDGEETYKEHYTPKKRLFRG
ncbi:hypothetical protein JCM8547_002571 [Rhodosporidiobolus lusitaniae]